MSKFNYLNHLIDRRSLTPIYDQVCAGFKQLIYRQHLQFGAVIPSISQIKSSTGLSTQEIENMYSTLSTLKLIRFDKDHYVCNYSLMSSQYFDFYIGMFEVIRKMGLKPNYRVIDHYVVSQLDTCFKNNAKITDETYLYVSRLYLGNDTAISFIESYYPMSLYPGILNIDFGSLDYNNKLESISGKKHTGYNQRFFSIYPDSQLIELLNADSKTPLMQFIALGHSNTNEIIEYNKTTLFEGAVFKRVLPQDDVTFNID